eukprot:COSAG01_NODE_50630_length_361_cov_7.293893_1_plen_74_part_01
MTLGSAVTAGGPLKWQSASTAEGEGGSRNSEGDEGGAAVVKQAMAYESEDSDDEERALRTFEAKSKSGAPLSFK